MGYGHTYTVQMPLASANLNFGKYLINEFILYVTGATELDSR